MTKEERAQIARDNGAKSKGPTTAAGKAKSSRNGIKTGEHTTTLSSFLPPDCAILCTEDRQAFFELMDSLIEAYQPANNEALSLVRQMAIARWQVERLNTALTAHWNLAVIEATAKPLTVIPDLADIQVLARASEAVNSGPAIADKLNRQIDRLEMRITRLRRAIRDVNAHSPAPVEVYTPTNQTQPSAPPSVENTELNQQTEQQTNKSEPPIYITERDSLVIAAYRREFPGRKIILLPPDDVAKCSEPQY
jgi:methyl-accepting chemotaxis protein